MGYSWELEFSIKQTIPNPMVWDLEHKTSVTWVDIPNKIPYKLFVEKYIGTLFKLL